MVDDFKLYSTRIIARRHNKDSRDLERIRRYIIYTIEKVQRDAYPHCFGAHDIFRLLDDNSPLVGSCYSCKTEFVAVSKLKSFMMKI